MTWRGETGTWLINDDGQAVETRIEADIARRYSVTSSSGRVRLARRGAPYQRALLLELHEQAGGTQVRWWFALWEPLRILLVIVAAVWFLLIIAAAAQARFQNVAVVAAVWVFGMVLGAAPLVQAHRAEPQMLEGCHSALDPHWARRTR
jgi:hypothetical protein